MEQQKYEFRKIRREEIGAMFDLILRRIKWMDEMGIHQWNETSYETRYPLSYYIENMDYTYVLVDSRSEQLVCAGVLYESDERWEENPDWSGGGKAVYLHHFVTDTEAKGTGKIFMKYAEELAASRGFEYFRLDSAVGNEKLEQYYTSMGFVEAGKCIDGPYYGVMREKKLISGKHC